jgi:hypothetical protein
MDPEMLDDACELVEPQQQGDDCADGSDYFERIRRSHRLVA